MLNNLILAATLALSAWLASSSLCECPPPVEICNDLDGDGVVTCQTIVAGCNVPDFCVFGEQ